MGRRSGFVGPLVSVAKEAARAQRQAEAERRRQIREQERAAREHARFQTQLAKVQKQRYAEDRVLETEEMNAALMEQVEGLRSILQHTLTIDDTISFDSLRLSPRFAPFRPPDELSRPILAPIRDSFFAGVQPLTWSQKLIPGMKTKHERALQQAEESYQSAFARYQAAESRRVAEINRLAEQHEELKHAHLQKVEQRNAEVDEFKAAYFSSDGQAIIAYNTMVLERSEYPDGFPQEFRLAYAPESKELVIEYELPGVDVTPAQSEYKYVKARDAIESKPRKQTEIKELYQDLVAAVALRTIHEVFEADQGNHLAVVTFNGFVQTVDPTTGRDVRPHLVSVRATKERFEEINLSRIDKRACLRNLGAQVSPRPEEQQPVKPLVEFNMVDKRFVEGSDVISELDARPNLMDLNPFEFEQLVGNLFSKMGLETRQTQASRDGGVDVVAYDTRPILGGKVVIQAKRYRHTVGVSAVRDLYGTMLNEGASKGILVSTSGYGSDAFNFAKDKPIELIDGGGLLYLLENHAGVRARIVMPDE
ncbi:MAG TPA: restriction endonuclease [Pyrinomonadaceae bacterium]|nr:restriction endonuclease [Pyrinomonadaceae bacterium]